MRNVAVRAIQVARARHKKTDAVLSIVAHLQWVFALAKPKRNIVLSKQLI
jgi:hypothetical protein